jgi:hypothetical protein
LPGIVPGVERQPLKKLAADEIALLKLLIDGARKPRKQDAGSNALQSPSRDLHQVSRLQGVHIEQAKGFKASLAEQTSLRTSERLSNPALRRELTKTLARAPPR